MKVAAFGEVLMRLATKKGVLISNSNEFNMNFGGGETNVLVALSNFGVETRMITKISEDRFGDGMLSYLKSKSIDTKYVIRGEGRTPIYFLEVGSGNRNSKVIYDRKNSVFSSICSDEIEIEDALKDIDILHFSGITLAISEDVRELTFKILEHCRKNSILVSYDSNYRAKMWSLEQASNTTKMILPYVNILSAGILDAENILNMKCDIEDKYKKLEHYYCEITKKYPNVKHIYSSIREIKSVSVNTLQSSYYIDGKIYFSKIYEIDNIVDRIGGGDALTAGILYAIISNNSSEYVSEFSVAASVLKHSIYGDANLVSVDEVEDIMKNGVNRIVR